MKRHFYSLVQWLWTLPRLEQRSRFSLWRCWWDGGESGVWLTSPPFPVTLFVRHGKLLGFQGPTSPVRNGRRGSLPRFVKCLQCSGFTMGPPGWAYHQERCDALRYTVSKKVSVTCLQVFSSWKQSLCFPLGGRPCTEQLLARCGGKGLRGRIGCCLHQECDSQLSVTVGWAALCFQQPSLSPCMPGLPGEHPARGRIWSALR